MLDPQIVTLHLKLDALLIVLREEGAYDPDRFLELYKTILEDFTEQGQLSEAVANRSFESTSDLFEALDEANEDAGGKA